MKRPIMPRLHLFTLGAVLAGAIAATPASAAPKFKTRVVECGVESCLVVSGRRDHAASPVSINGRRVAVSGGRKWRARVPVETVRKWSAPYARSITVSVAGTEEEARLPIGLLGHAEDLAMLVVSAK